MSRMSSLSLTSLKKKTFLKMFPIRFFTIGEVCENKSNKQPLFSFSEVTRD